MVPAHAPRLAEPKLRSGPEQGVPHYQDVELAGCLLSAFQARAWCLKVEFRRHSGRVIACIWIAI